MKLCTFFSESHRCFLKRFVNSFSFEPGMDLVIRNIPQLCSGNILEKDWMKAMEKKIDYVIECLETAKDGEIVIHSDCDVQFFKPFSNDIVKHLQKCDIVFQNDYAGKMCAGFFAAKNHKVVRSLFKTVKMKMHEHQNDQYAMNHYIPLYVNQHGLSVGTLPEKYFTYGMYNKQWTERIGDNFIIPNDIMMHHANWVVGVDDKLKLMDIVKQKVEQ